MGKSKYSPHGLLDHNNRYNELLLLIMSNKNISYYKKLEVWIHWQEKEPKQIHNPYCTKDLYENVFKYNIYKEYFLLFNLSNNI